MKILIIGVGGIGSMLIPALAHHELIIADGDSYEDHNATRQVFAETGRKKVDVMEEKFNRHGTITTHPEMLTGGETFEGLDVIISCVDSNSGRVAAKNIADNHNCKLIIAQNTEWNPMAWLYLPSRSETEADPFMYDELAQLGNSSAEFHCESLKAAQEGGQSAYANHAAGGAALTILHSIIEMPKSKFYLANVKSAPWPEYKKIGELTGEIQL